MDPQLDERLSAIERSLEENKKILLKMRGVQRNANLMKLAYWGVIIILGIGLAIFMKPYLSMLGSAYDVGGDTKGMDYNALIEQYKALQSE